MDESSSAVDPVGELSKGNLRRQGESLVGTGRVLMQSSLRSLRDSYHIALAGRFLHNESTFTVHLFFDDFDYDTGIRLRFSLVADPEHSEQLKDIAVEVAEPGYSYRSLIVLENALTKNKEFNIHIEAINRMNNSRRLLVWNNQLQLDSESWKPREKFIEGNADFDSLRDQFTFFTWGRGLRWGLSLSKMRINQLKREVPFVDL